MDIVTDSLVSIKRLDILNAYINETVQKTRYEKFASVLDTNQLHDDDDDNDDDDDDDDDDDYLGGGGGGDRITCVSVRITLHFKPRYNTRHLYGHTYMLSSTCNEYAFILYM